MTNWINVNDRLPDIGVDVLLYSPVEGIEIGSLEKYDYTDSGYAYFVNKNGFNDIERYLYWMPLPRPPKEGQYV